MSDKHEQDWGNYWRGRAEQSYGEVLIDGVGIENNKALAEFWANAFKSAPSSTRIVDLACGAGSVLKHAHAAHLETLTGIDIAPEAIELLQKAIPNTNGIVSPVTSLPCDDNSFDIVASQFGFEYAGSPTDITKAAAEMARILAPGGKFIAISHMAGGAIERESKAALQDIDALSNSGFIDAAKTVFITEAAVRAEPGQAKQEAHVNALVALNNTEKEIIAWLQSQQGRNNEFAKFGEYLVGSTRQMYGHVAKLQLDECTKWLDDMDFEIGAYRGRMSSMVAAALTKEMGIKILSAFDEAGFSVAEPEPFVFEASRQPAAWVLRAG